MDWNAKEAHIIQVAGDLLDVMDVSTDLVQFLISTHAFNRFAMEKIIIKPNKHERVEALLDHICKNLKTKYEPLLAGLRHTKQDRAVHILESKANPQHRVHLREDVIPAFTRCMTTLAKTYRRYAASFSIFKDHPEFRSYRTDMSHIYTNLTLLDGPACADERSGISVTLRKALSSEGTNYVMIGLPGSGKSCCILKAAESWGSTQYLQETPSPSASSTPPTINTNPLPSHIKQVIHVRPRDCTSSLDRTVETILHYRCGEDSYAAVLHFYNKPQETAVLIDSLDEVMFKNEFINDVYHQMNLGKRLFLVGCRTNHPVLGNIETECDIKWIRVEGFDEFHMKEYIDKFFNRSHLGGSTLVRQFQQAVDKDKRLVGIVKTPLVLTLLCILLQEGKYTIDDLRRVTKVDIYNDVIEMAMKREKFSDESDLKLFYKYCLLALVEGGDFFEKDMKSFGIKEPKYLPFLSLADASASEAHKGCQVIIPHRSFAEYACAKCIFDSDERTKECLLIFLSARREMNDVIAFITELMQLEFQKIECISNVILATQPNELNPWHISFMCRNSGNRRLAVKIRDLKIRDIVMQSKHGFISQELANIKPCHQCWRKAGYVQTDEGRAVFHNALAAMQAIDDVTLRDEVFYRALSPVLPFRLDDGSVILAVPMSDRCTSLSAVDGGFSVAANRASDVATSQILSNLPTAKAIASLQLNTKSQGSIYGHEIHKDTADDWGGLFTHVQKLVKKDTIKMITFYPDSDSDGLFAALPTALVGLCSMGVKKLAFPDDSVNAAALMQFDKTLKEEGWLVKEGDNEMAVLHREHPRMMSIELELYNIELLLADDEHPIQQTKQLAFLLRHAIKGSGLKLQIPEVKGWIGMRGATIQTCHPLHLVQTGALGLYTGWEMGTLVLTTDQRDDEQTLVPGLHKDPETDILYMTPVQTDDELSLEDHGESQNDWSSFLQNLLDEGPKLTAGGQVVLRHDNKTSFDDIFVAVSENIENLAKYMPDGCMHLYKGSVTGKLILEVINKLSQHWVLRGCGVDGMALYRRGADGKKLLAIGLLSTIVICKDEKDDVEKVIHKTGIVFNPYWEIVK